MIMIEGRRFDGLTNPASYQQPLLAIATQQKEFEALSRATTTRSHQNPTQFL
jgi:hypothetical protein